MKSKELRLGNLVMFEGNIVKIDGIQPTWVWFDDMSSHSMYGIEPIPLTEEWLVKLGFGRNGKVWEIDSINGIVFEIEYVSDCYYLHTYGEWGYQGFLYVHQLQNLYKALTGQELTISE